MKMDRRDFIRSMGAAVVLGGAATIPGCKSKKDDKKDFDDVELDGTMTYRTNNGSGDIVSILGYGCMRWPMTKDSEGNDIIDQETVNELVDYAIKYGVNYFDTAPLYLQGLSEAATGTALKRHPRDSYFIATKLSNFSDHTREAALEMYHNSFKRLQTDYIDYYLLHSIGGGGIENFNKRYIDNGVLDFLLEERKAGRIRHLGFSFHGDKEAFDEFLKLHDKYHWDFVQIQLNYVDWNFPAEGGNAEYLQSELDKRGIQSIIMEPLLGGRLAKLPDNIANRLKERDPKASLASWAFRFAGTPKGVLCVLSGMTYIEHLQDNLKTYSPLVSMTEDEIEFMNDTAVLMQNYPTIPCNDCKYCMPCPYGIDIPAIIGHYNKCVNEGYIVEDERDPEYAKARRAYLISYDRAVPKLRQASRCIGCGKCITVKKCPQGIDIPKELHKIDRYIEDLRRNG